MKVKSEKLKVSRKVILFSPRGKKFTAALAKKWSKLDQLILICGRYEGVDERVARHIADDVVSIGDFVLNGGEVAAMVIIEAVSRLVPGVIAKPESVKYESFSDKGSKAKEYPQYTRPEVITLNGKKLRVPKVLLSGNHGEIEKWRKRHSK